MQDFNSERLEGVELEGVGLEGCRIESVGLEGCRIGRVLDWKCVRVKECES